MVSPHASQYYRICGTSMAGVGKISDQGAFDSQRARCFQRAPKISTQTGIFALIRSPQRRSTAAQGGVSR